MQLAQLLPVYMCGAVYDQNTLRYSEILRDVHSFHRKSYSMQDTWTIKQTKECLVLSLPCRVGMHIPTIYAYKHKHICTFILQTSTVLNLQYPCKQRRGRHTSPAAILTPSGNGKVNWYNYAFMGHIDLTMEAASTQSSTNQKQEYVMKD